MLSCAGCGAFQTELRNQISFKCEYCGRVNFQKEQEAPSYNDQMLQLAESAFLSEVEKLNNPKFPWNSENPGYAKPDFINLEENHYKRIAANFFDSEKAQKGEPLPFQNVQSLKAHGRFFAIWFMRGRLYELDDKFNNDRGSHLLAFNAIRRKVTDSLNLNIYEDNIPNWGYKKVTAKILSEVMNDIRFRGLTLDQETTLMKSFIESIEMTWQSLHKQLFERIIYLLPERILRKKSCAFSLLGSFFRNELGFKEEILFFLKAFYDHHNLEYGFKKKEMIGFITNSFVSKDVIQSLTYPKADKNFLLSQLKLMRNNKGFNTDHQTLSWALSEVSKVNNFSYYQ